MINTFLDLFQQQDTLLIFHQNIDHNIDHAKGKRQFTSFTSPVFKSNPFFFVFVSETTKHKVKFNIYRDKYMIIKPAATNMAFAILKQSYKPRTEIK